MTAYDDAPVDEVCEFCGMLPFECHCCHCCDCGAAHDDEELAASRCKCCGGEIIDFDA
jgi:hypothetical protein